MLPLCVSNSRVMSDSSVVFPAPLRPSTAVKRPLRNGQGDVVQDTALAIGVADAIHRQGGREGGDCVRGRHDVHCGDTTTPQGSRPTGIDFTTFSRRDVDDRNIVGQPVGGQQVFFVRGERHLPDPLPDQQVFFHRSGLRIDHRDAVGRPERDERQAVVLSETNPHRLDRLVAQALDVEMDLYSTTCPPDR